MSDVEDAPRLERLVALRDTQEQSLASSEVSVRDFASLSREYRATLAEIDELTPNEEVGDGIDEIAKRRATRRGGTSTGSGSAKRSS